MRVITKRFLITFLSLFLGLTVVACNKTTTEEITTPNDSIIPELSNPDDIYISTDNYDITYGELYDEVMRNDGLSQLLLMVDTDLLSEYIAEITPAEVEEKVKFLTYGTSDDDLIALMSDEEKAEAEELFENSLYFLGYHDNVAGYVNVQIARDKYAASTLRDEANSEETWYPNIDAIVNYYSLKYYQPINTIMIRFNSELDAKNIIRDLNLVSKNGELLLYTGTTPLEEVPSSNLDETNTRALTDSEIIEYYLKMYNVVYGDYKDEIDDQSTLAELLEVEDFQYEKKDLEQVSALMSKFVFDSLGAYQKTEENQSFYTYAPIGYYQSSQLYYFMLLNLDKDVKVDLSEFDGDQAALEALIGEETYDEIVDLKIKESVTSTFTNNRMVELRSENGFVIYDYFLGLDYTLASSNYDSNETGHPTIVASYGEEEITADEFLKFCLDINAPIYTLYVAQANSAYETHFEDLYCVEGETCVYDVYENDSDLMVQHRADALAAKSEFESGYYSAYYTYEEYIYLAYGAKSEAELLLKYYVNSALKPYQIFDEIIKNDYDLVDKMIEIMQPYYDNYFSLNADHLLIYIDRDQNGLPDDYIEYYSNLEDSTIFDQKISDFETQIMAYLDVSDNSIYTFEQTYNKAQRDDATWGEFINYGFYVKAEKLGEITYKDTIESYDPLFVDGLLDIDAAYHLSENSSKSFIYSDGLVQTSFGVHLIKAQKGTDFDQPDGKFAMTYDTETGDPLYLADLVNLNEAFTREQIITYIKYRFAEIVGEADIVEAIYGYEEISLPAKLKASFEEYLQFVNDSFYVVGNSNAIVGSEVLAGTYVNSQSQYCSITEAVFDTKIAEIIDIYLDQVYAAYEID